MSLASIELRTSQGSTTIPFTYDVKVALLEVNETAGNKAVEAGDTAAAVRAFRDNLKLFYKGEQVMAEGLQYLATSAQLRKLRAVGTLGQAEEDVRGGLRIWSRVKERISKIFSIRPRHALPITIDLDDERFGSFTNELLYMQEVAMREGQKDRVTEILSLFRKLEKDSLWGVKQAYPQ